MFSINEKMLSVLKRQLKKIDINENDISSEKKDAWWEFIKLINRTYKEYEEERYLIERIMDKSSAEMLELNERLTAAQSLARLGYWIFNLKEYKFMWQSGVDQILGINALDQRELKEYFVSQIDDLGKEKLINFREQLKKKNFDREIEIYSYNESEKNYYYYILKGCHNEQFGYEKDPDVVSGIIFDVTERKKAELEKDRLHSKLISLSRSAGRSEIASVILHNVGNVLNTANVENYAMIEMLSESSSSKLSKTCEIVYKNIKNTRQLATDSQENLYLEYMLELAKQVEHEQKEISESSNKLKNLLEHINHIVAMQNEVSGVSNMKETINLGELVDNAIQISGVDNKASHIQIDKYFDSDIIVYSDKSKLTQILVNLIKNAKESIMESDKSEKRLKISLNKDKKYVDIIVADNGIGIAKDNLSNVFKLGFTTKHAGHGFGMHSSLIAANELNADLTVESDGPGQGASFKLTLYSEKVDDGGLILKGGGVSHEPA